MIALSVLAPYAAPLWASFGAAAGAAGGILGSIGTAVYTAGNWVAGTLGAMSSGISKAIGTIAEGGFSGLANGSLSKAASQAVGGFAEAFTGAAGKAGIQAGTQAATNFAIKEAAGQTLLDQTVNKITGDVAGNAATQTLADTNARISENLVSLNPANQSVTLGHAATKAGVQSATDFSVDSLASTASSQFVPQALETQGLNVIKGQVSSKAGTSLLSKTTDVAKAMLSNSPQDIGANRVQAVGDVGGQRFGGNAYAQGGTGASGGSFLSEAMLNAMQMQTQRMTRGFS
jgi:hypothetical protein